LRIRQPEFLRYNPETGVFEVVSPVPGQGIVLELEVRSDVVSPEAGVVRIFGRPIDGGKHQIVVVFPSGAEQILATEE
jgi:hypothetical protein